MTDQVFSNPDMGLLYHTLSKAQAQSVAEIKELIGEQQVVQGVFENRLTSLEEVQRELRVTHQIFTQLAQNFGASQQRSEEMRDDYKTIIGKLEAVSSGVTDLNHSRQNMSEAVAEIKTKVDHIATTQSRFDASSTQIRKDLDKLTKSVEDLDKASETAEEFQVEVRSTVRALMWAAGLLSTGIVACLIWFSNIVMQDHEYITENRKAIEQMQENKK